MMQRFGCGSWEKWKEREGHQYLCLALYQRGEVLSLVVGKRVKVISTKLKITAITNRIKNNEFKCRNMGERHK